MEKGALFLAKNLSSLKSLRMLNVSYNEIRHDGALAVVKEVTKLPVFEKINLNGNQLGEVGCELVSAEMDLANQGHKLDELDEDNEPDDDEEEDETQNDENISFDEFKHKPSYQAYLQLGPGKEFREFYIELLI